MSYRTPCLKSVRADKVATLSAQRRNIFWLDCNVYTGLLAQHLLLGPETLVAHEITIRPVCLSFNTLQRHRQAKLMDYVSVTSIFPTPGSIEIWVRQINGGENYLVSTSKQTQPILRLCGLTKTLIHHRSQP